MIPGFGLTARPGIPLSVAEPRLCPKTAGDHGSEHEAGRDRGLGAVCGGPLRRSGRLKARNREIPGKNNGLTLVEKRVNRTV